MRRKYISFYAEMTKQKSEYTLYINPETKDVYKSIHKPINPSLMVLPVILFLGLIRVMMHVPIAYDSLLIRGGLALLTIMISVGIIIFFDRKTQGERRIIYLSPSEISGYMVKGRKYFKNELIAAVCLSIFSSIFMLLFLMNWSLIWLFLLFFFVMFSGVFMRNLSITRYNILFKNSLDF